MATAHPHATRVAVYPALLYKNKVSKHLNIGSITFLYLRIGWIGTLNKAGYTATLVACGWAGAPLAVTP